MSDIVIQVEDVSKQYRLGKIGTGTFSHDLNRWWHTMRGKEDPYLKIGEINDRSKRGESEYVWALKDISFDVRQGDVVGIIGKNGAGKSTLLKILSRTTLPTTGSIKIKGRVASLLEVGTGFHPELTGRENIFLNGAILGMRKWEIKKKFDEIVDFSGVEKYIDTPVKRYSSGMYVRLAFAVAAHLEPEILIVDEVLAVGDAEFQKKAIGKMQNVSQADGRTVLFVSHNMGAISNLTRNCILMHQGGLEAYGNTPEIVQKYFTHSMAKSSKDQGIDINYFRRKVEKGAPVYIRNIFVNDGDAAGAEVVMFKMINITIELEVLMNINGANLTIVLKNSQGEKVAILFSWDHDIYLHLDRGTHFVQISFENILAPDSYYVDIGINQSTATTAYDVVNDFFICTVRNDGKVLQWQERPWGLVHFKDVKWKLEKKQ